MMILFKSTQYNLENVLSSEAGSTLEYQTTELPIDRRSRLLYRPAILKSTQYSLENILSSEAGSILEYQTTELTTDRRSRLLYSSIYACKYLRTSHRYDQVRFVILFPPSIELVLE
jgi:hypothetical protein